MNLTLGQVAFIVTPLLLIEGFYAGSEIALLSADQLALKAKAQQGSHRARKALELLKFPERILSTTLLMTCLCVIGISSIITLYFISIQHPRAELLSILITSPLIVILGELIPKTIYQRYGRFIVPWVAYPIHFTFMAFFPLTKALSLYTSRVTRMMKPIEEMLTGKRKSTREEIRALLTYTRKESEIKPSERSMIKRIFDFKDTEAKHALIPLVKVEAIDETATIHEALEKFQRNRHSRMPIYSERIDNIVGVLEMSDLFSVVGNPQLLDHSVKKFMGSPHYVPETQSLEDLLFTMKREDNEMVVVVDEYGGAVGVLTFEDIIEEIVGEIEDEYDYEISPYKELNSRSWLIQARMEIQQINEALRLDIPEGEYETVGGFLLQQFARIPEAGDELYFETASSSLKFTIKKANERQIEFLIVERTEDRREE